MAAESLCGPRPGSAPVFFRLALRPLAACGPQARILGTLRVFGDQLAVVALRAFGKALRTVFQGPLPISLAHEIAPLRVAPQRKQFICEVTEMARCEEQTVHKLPVRGRGVDENAD